MLERTPASIKSKQAKKAVRQNTTRKLFVRVLSFRTYFTWEYIKPEETDIWVAAKNVFYLRIVDQNGTDYYEPIMNHTKFQTNKKLSCENESGVIIKPFYDPTNYLPLAGAEGRVVIKEKPKGLKKVPLEEIPKPLESEYKGKQRKKYFIAPANTTVAPVNMMLDSINNSQPQSLSTSTCNKQKIFVRVFHDQKILYNVSVPKKSDMIISYAKLGESTNFSDIYFYKDKNSRRQFCLKISDTQYEPIFLYNTFMQHWIKLRDNLICYLDDYKSKHDFLFYPSTLYHPMNDGSDRVIFNSIPENLQPLPLNFSVRIDIKNTKRMLVNTKRRQKKVYDPNDIVNEYTYQEFIKAFPASDPNVPLPLTISVNNLHSLNTNITNIPLASQTIPQRKNNLNFICNDLSATFSNDFNFQNVWNENSNIQMIENQTTSSCDPASEKLDEEIVEELYWGPLFDDDQIDQGTLFNDDQIDWRPGFDDDQIADQIDNMTCNYPVDDEFFNELQFEKTIDNAEVGFDNQNLGSSNATSQDVSLSTNQETSSVDSTPSVDITPRVDITKRNVMLAKFKDTFDAVKNGLGFTAAARQHFGAYQCVEQFNTIIEKFLLEILKKRNGKYFTYELIDTNTGEVIETTHIETLDQQQSIDSVSSMLNADKNNKQKRESQNAIDQMRLIKKKKIERQKSKLKTKKTIVNEFDENHLLNDNQTGGQIENVHLDYPVDDISLNNFQKTIDNAEVRTTVSIPQTVTLSATQDASPSDISPHVDIAKRNEMLAKFKDTFAAVENGVAFNEAAKKHLRCYQGFNQYNAIIEKFSLKILKEKLSYTLIDTVTGEVIEAARKTNRVPRAKKTVKEFIECLAKVICECMDNNFTIHNGLKQLGYKSFDDLEDDLKNNYPLVLNRVNKIKYEIRHRETDELILKKERDKLFVAENLERFNEIDQQPSDSFLSNLGNFNNRPLSNAVPNLSISNQPRIFSYPVIPILNADRHTNQKRKLQNEMDQMKLIRNNKVAKCQKSQLQNKPPESNIQVANNPNSFFHNDLRMSQSETPLDQFSFLNDPGNNSGNKIGNI